MKNIAKNTIFRFYKKKNIVRYQALFLMVSTTTLLCKASELPAAKADNNPEMVVLVWEDQREELSFDAAQESETLGKRLSNTDVTKKEAIEIELQPDPETISSEILPLLVSCLKQIHEERVSAERNERIANYASILDNNRLTDTDTVSSLLKAAHFFKVRVLTTFLYNQKHEYISNELIDLLKLKQWSFAIQELLEVGSIPQFTSNIFGQTTLDLSHKQIYSLIGLNNIDGINQVRELDLDNNQLQNLEPSIFEGLNNLDELDLGHNHLEAIKPSTFAGLNNLEGLGLDHNRLETLKPDVFAGLINLETLDLGHNQLQTLVPGVFEGLNNLEWLNLGHNHLQAIKPGVFEGLNNLYWLDLQYNHLEALDPRVFAGLNNFRWLWLNNNQLQYLFPCAFEGLDNLHWLVLRNNQLQTLDPGVFAGLNNLRWLDLDNNNLTTLNPRVFAGLDNLEKLKLNNNQLQTLVPDVFAGLNNLEVLELENYPAYTAW